MKRKARLIFVILALVIAGLLYYGGRKQGESTRFNYAVDAAKASAEVRYKDWAKLQSEFDKEFLILSMQVGQTLQQSIDSLVGYYKKRSDDSVYISPEQRPWYREHIKKLADYPEKYRYLFKH